MRAAGRELHFYVNFDNNNFVTVISSTHKTPTLNSPSKPQHESVFRFYLFNNVFTCIVFGKTKR